jgi:hypothetical protein
MLASLPVLADRLHELPQAELRAIFESLQLTLIYDPSAHEAEIEICEVMEPREPRKMLRSGLCPRWGLDRSSDDCSD